ncbi:hypothetical protein DEO12_17905 [Escherichia coli]|nr:hypothetical protein DEO12_17905 [Escherichia coli]
MCIKNGKGCPAIFSSSDNRVSRIPFLRSYSASISAAFLSAFCASFCRFSACSINDLASRGDIRRESASANSIRLSVCVNATMFDRLISLALTTRQSYQAWCQSVHNFSIGAAYHR